MPAFARGRGSGHMGEGHVPALPEPSTLPPESESTGRGAEERGPVRFEGA